MAGSVLVAATALPLIPTDGLCHAPGGAEAPHVAPPAEAERRRAREAIEDGRAGTALGGSGP